VNNVLAAARSVYSIYFVNYVNMFLFWSCCVFQSSMFLLVMWLLMACRHISGLPIMILPQCTEMASMCC